MVSSLLTILLLGGLSIAFFPVIISALVTINGAMLLFVIFRHQIERYYLWFERTFVAGIEPGNKRKAVAARSHDHLLPWDAHLARIEVERHPFFVGKTLLELQLRERFALNVVVIKRGEQDLVAPQAVERIFPGDELLCFATDAELANLNTVMNQAAVSSLQAKPPSNYVLRPFAVSAKSPFAGKTIREAGIREAFDCIIVGIERAGTRIQSPKSDWALNGDDLLWVVGDGSRLLQLQEALR